MEVISLGSLEVSEEEEYEVGLEAPGIERIHRFRTGKYEVEFSNGLLVWMEEAEVRETAGEAVAAFEAREPVRKKRRREEREKEKARKAASELAVRRASREALLACFLWELAMAFKTGFTTGRFSYTKKVFFRVNYLERLEAAVLRRAAEERFAPPLQRVRSACELALRRLSDVKRVVLAYAGLPEDEGVWGKLDLGPPVERGGVLEMALPRRHDLRRLAPSLSREWQDMNHDWWTRIGSLAAAIARAEAAMPRDDARRTLLRVEPPIAPTSLHSLELVVRFADAVVATMIVPNDATLSSVGDWIIRNVAINRRFQPQLSGAYSFGCSVLARHADANSVELHVPVSQTLSRFGWRAEPEGLGGTSWTAVESVYGSRAALLDTLRAAALPEHLAPPRDGLDDPFECYDPYCTPDYAVKREDFSSTHRTIHLAVFKNCAVGDVVPMPDEYDPPMSTVIEFARDDATDRATHFRGSQWGGTASFYWSKTFTHVGLACLRRLPRLPDNDDYPVVKLCNTTQPYFGF